MFSLTEALLLFICSTGIGMSFAGELKNIFFFCHVPVLISSLLRHTSRFATYTNVFCQIFCVFVVGSSLVDTTISIGGSSAEKGFCIGGLLSKLNQQCWLNLGQSMSIYLLLQSIIIMESKTAIAAILWVCVAWFNSDHAALISLLSE